MGSAELQPEPPEGTLVQNEGVDAGELTDRRPGAEAARRGGRPEKAEEQVEDAEQSAGDELVGAPGATAERHDDGGQDAGRMA